MNRTKKSCALSVTRDISHTKQQTRGTTLESVHQLEEKYEVQDINLSGIVYILKDTHVNPDNLL